MQTISSARPIRAGWLPIAANGRNRLAIGAFAIGLIAAALAWQWSWLVAIGVAPLLLSVAPCAAMCGLGLCMHRRCGHAGGTAGAEMPRRQTDPGPIGSPAGPHGHDGTAT